MNGATAVAVPPLWAVGLLAALAGAFAVALLAATTGGALRFGLAVARARRDRGSLDALPRWLRWGVPCARVVARHLGPWIPAIARERLNRLLRHAELDELLDPQQFLALGALWACLGCAAALSVGPNRFVGLLLGSACVALPWGWLRDCMYRRDAAVLRDLPAYIDMLTLALEAGGALSVAVRVASEQAPESPLRRALMRLQGDLRTGRSRVEALRALAHRLDLPAVTSFVSALVQAEASGASLAGVLRAQSDQRLDERFARAEKLALEAPVKMLAPLILCIFPCTFIMLAFPVAMSLMDHS